MRLEPEIWDALEEICKREQVSLGDLIRQAEADGLEGGRTSAVRVFAFRYFRRAACEQGHREAGHGALR